MLLQKGNREDAILALINTFLKDSTLRCGMCGKTYTEGVSCCEAPFIATNQEIFRQFRKELIYRRQQQKNKWASTENKTLRVALSFPPLMLDFLTKSFMAMYNEELFNDEYTHTWFAQKFGKYFAVAEEI